jgi:hypothetical protein
VTTNYQYSSRGSDNTETITVTSPIPGNWFLLLRGASSFAGVTLTVSAGQAQGTTARPEFSHPPGSHGAPFDLSISCRDTNAIIHYSTTAVAPINGFQMPQGTSIPVHQFAVTVKAIAWAPGKRPSPEISGTFYIRGGARELLWTNSGLAGGIEMQSTLLSGMSQTGSKEFVDIPFFFDVPSDPIPGTPRSTLEYPVAIAVNKSNYPGRTQVFLQQGRSATSSSLQAESLPAINTYAGFGNPTYILGTVTGKKGHFLSTNARYYGILRIWGDPNTNTASGSSGGSGAVITLTLDKHNGRLIGSAEIKANQLNTKQ